MFVDDGIDFVECAALGGHCLSGHVNCASNVQERAMRKSLLFVGAVVAMLASSPVLRAEMQQGQEQGTGQSGRGSGQPMTADQRLDRMSKQLNLSDAQQQQIKPLLENESTQMQALREDTSLSQQDRWAKMTQIRQEFAAQIKPILNPDQQKQFEEMTNRQRQGRGPGGPGQAPSSTQPPQQ
jgi:periplasmic protein CpxP/Spy